MKRNPGRNCHTACACPNSRFIYIRVTFHFPTLYCHFVIRWIVNQGTDEMFKWNRLRNHNHNSAGIRVGSAPLGINVLSQPRPFQTRIVTLLSEEGVGGPSLWHLCHLSQSAFRQRAHATSIVQCLQRQSWPRKWNQSPAQCSVTQ